MSSERTTRVTAISALLLAGLSLGVSLVSLGCERRGDVSAEQARGESQAPEAKNAEGARMPSEPLVQEPAPATVPTIQHIASAVHAPPAQPKAAPHSAGTPGNVAGGLKVKRLVLTNSIEGREPAQVEGFRSGDGPVVAFIEAQNALSEAQNIVVTFEHASGTKVGFVKLQIPENSSRWRTWARSSHINKAGAWTAVVRTGDGEELARQGFEVQG